MVWGGIMSGKPDGHTSDVKLLDGKATSVPGQTVLPGMQKDVGYDSIELEPWQEHFCWEYVENGGIGYKAYLAAKPKVKEATARVEASKLLTLPNIQARIAAIRKELRARYAITADDLIEHHGKVIKIDRRRFFKDGRAIPIHELDHELASIVDLTTVHVKGAGIVMMPVVANREESKAAMAKILGLEKSTVNLNHQFEDLSDEELQAQAEAIARDILEKQQAAAQ